MANETMIKNMPTAPMDLDTGIEPERSVPAAMLNGIHHRCPNCGIGPLYWRYLKIQDACTHCGEELHHHRADDAPPYFTILIVAHIVGAGILALEQSYAPAAWIHATIWLPLTLMSSLLLLPRIKGALVALQWALRMHGFAADTGDDHRGDSSDTSQPFDGANLTKT